MGKTAEDEIESLRRAMAHPLRAFERWLHERRTAEALGALDDATLTDIGVRRCDIPRLVRERCSVRMQRREGDESAPVSSPAGGDSPARGLTVSGSTAGQRVAAMGLTFGGVCATWGYDAARLGLDAAGI